MAEDELEEIDLSTATVDEATGEIIPGAEPSLLDTPAAFSAQGWRFSASLLSDYVQCPAKAYARMTRQPSVKTVALINGIAVHEALEAYEKNPDQTNPVDKYQTQFEFEADKARLPKSELTDKVVSEGVEMIGTAIGPQILGAEMPDGRQFVRHLDPNLIEHKFDFTRDGRLWVGKIDLMHFFNSEQYSIADWKTGRTAPSDLARSTDRQFSLYAYAASHDPTLKTFGVWPTRMAILHLRGKNVSGIRKSKKNPEPDMQYSFPITRTEDRVEDMFENTLNPVAEQIEKGVFYRVEGDHCGWCPYFDRYRGRCGATLPERTKIHG